MKVIKFYKNTYKVSEIYKIHTQTKTILSSSLINKNNISINVSIFL